MQDEIVDDAQDMILNDLQEDDIEAEFTDDNRRDNDSDRRDDDRRTGMDRRCNLKPYGGTERRKDADERRSCLERRRGPGKRRTDSRKSAEEGEMNDEQFEFIRAIDEYKRVNGRPFPSFTEILEIAKSLGYRKVADPVSLDTLHEHE